MYYTYVFMKKVSDNYYQPISIDRVFQTVAPFLKLDNFDLAARIDDQAIRLIEYAWKNKEFPLIKADYGDMVSVDKIIVFSMEEFRKEILATRNPNKLKGKTIEELFDDEDLKNEYLFEKRKEEILKEILNQFFPMFNVWDLMNMIKYLEYWGILFNEGIVISEKNKEDKFIEIIEKDDDYLLEILEKFLEAKERFDKFNKSYSVYNNLIQEMDEVMYWDFDTFEEAIGTLDKIRNTYVAPENYTWDSDLYLFRKIRKEYLDKK